ncbi:cytochrome b [Pseudomonas sp. NPDC089734]|uniref:cytochrome b n=1 Tax=Pseudomonas sp. NPDC089734 TaxID=3364469 RepID=UPI0037F52248
MGAPSSERYTSRARWLHWLMAVLIIAAYALILSRTQFSKASEYRVLVVQSHFWVGLLILALAFFRVAERRRHSPPGITPPLEGVLRLAATTTHYALYAFLFVQPVLGFLTVMIEKGALPIPLTELQIPWPFATDDRFAERFEDLHKLLASIFYYVIGLHAVAAIWHHFVRKDNTLRRML